MYTIGFVLFLLIDVIALLINETVLDSPSSANLNQGKEIVSLYAQISPIFQREFFWGVLPLDHVDLLVAAQVIGGISYVEADPVVVLEHAEAAQKGVVESAQGIIILRSFQKRLVDADCDHYDSPEARRGDVIRVNGLPLVDLLSIKCSRGDGARPTCVIEETYFPVEPVNDAFHLFTYIYALCGDVPPPVCALRLNGENHVQKLLFQLLFAFCIVRDIGCFVVLKGMF